MTYDFSQMPDATRNPLIELARGVPDAFFASLHLALARCTTWAPPALDERAARRALDRCFTWATAARAAEKSGDPAASDSLVFLANLCADIWEQIEAPVN
jgi:hypothetical protein